VLNVGEIKDPYQAEAHRLAPIPDAAPAPSIDWLRQQVEFIDLQRRAGLPVYVHCQAGISRSVLVLAAYLMMRDGLTRDAALTAIRAKRSGAGPHAAFMPLLLEWQELQKR
jgi:protein-tyrosine phosphatase